jgi:hypothetical protein
VAGPEGIVDFVARHDPFALSRISGLPLDPAPPDSLRFDHPTWTNDTWTDPDPTVSSTPLPATLPLFATGLGALGLLCWRRKRKAHASVLGAP